MKDNKIIEGNNHDNKVEKVTRWWRCLKRFEKITKYAQCTYMRNIRNSLVD
jgi:hypothetical protein